MLHLHLLYSLIQTVNRSWGICLPVRVKQYWKQTLHSKQLAVLFSVMPTTSDTFFLLIYVVFFFHVFFLAFYKYPISFYFGNYLSCHVFSPLNVLNLVWTSWGLTLIYVSPLVYDVTRRETFTNLINVWAKEVELYLTNRECIKILVGNKVDRVSLYYYSTSILCQHSVSILS